MHALPLAQPNAVKEVGIYTLVVVSNQIQSCPSKGGQVAGVRRPSFFPNLANVSGVGMLASSLITSHWSPRKCAWVPCLQALSLDGSLTAESLANLACSHHNTTILFLDIVGSVVQILLGDP